MAKKEPEPEISPSQESRDFWPDDQFLRKATPAFVIEERWKNNEPKWRRFINGRWVLFGQEEALRIAHAEKRDAKVRLKSAA